MVDVNPNMTGELRGATAVVSSRMVFVQELCSDVDES